MVSANLLLRRPMDCVDAGQMDNTTTMLARHTSDSSLRPKGTVDGQYRYRVCVPADMPTDECDPGGDVVKQNAMAFTIVFVVQILAICFGKLVMKLKLRWLVENSNQARSKATKQHMKNMLPKMAKRVEQFMENAEVAETAQRNQDNQKKPASTIKGKALFKSQVMKTMFVARLTKKDTVEGMVAEITGAVAAHWEKYQWFFTFASLGALVATFIAAGRTVSEQSA